MSDINYNYEIKSVNEEARCMEVLYTSEGRDPVLVGVRIPFEGESLEWVIESFSPVAMWAAQETPIQSITAGLTGSRPTAAAWNAPSKDEVVRRQRNALLDGTDWTTLSDAPLSEAVKAEYLVYRQALRDLPLQAGFPDAFAWPAKPTHIPAEEIATVETM